MRANGEDGEAAAARSGSEVAGAAVVLERSGSAAAGGSRGDDEAVCRATTPHVDVACRQAPERPSDAPGSACTATPRARETRNSGAFATRADAMAALEIRVVSPIGPGGSKGAETVRDVVPARQPHPPDVFPPSCSHPHRAAPHRVSPVPVCVGGAPGGPPRPAPAGPRGRSRVTSPPLTPSAALLVRRPAGLPHHPALCPPRPRRRRPRPAARRRGGRRPRRPRGSWAASSLAGWTRSSRSATGAR